LNGFSFKEFRPEIPLTPSSDKFSKIGLKEDEFYPIQIEPKNVLDFNFDELEGEELEVKFDPEEYSEKRRIPVDFAFWMDMTGKFNKKTISSDIRDLLEIESFERNNWTPIKFAERFPKIRTSFQGKFKKDIEKFELNLQKEKSDASCVD